MHLWKRDELEHYSVPELTAKAHQVANGKGFFARAKYHAKVVSILGGNYTKKNLITFIETDGEGSGDSAPVTQKAKSWKKSKN